MKYLFPLFFCLLALNSCKETKEVQSTELPSTPKISENTPNSCDIQAVIVKILPLDNSSYDVCASHPCKAEIKLNKKENCGVDIDINLNQTIIVSFSNTLDATKGIKEVNNDSLPGLKEGDAFKARVFSKLTMGSGKTYTIHNYTKL